MNLVKKFLIVVVAVSAAAMSFADNLKRVDIPETKASFLIFEALPEPDHQKIEYSNPYVSDATTYTMTGESEGFFATFTVSKGKTKLPNIFLKTAVDGILEVDPEEKDVKYEILERKKGKFGAIVGQTYKRKVVTDDITMVELGLVIPSEDGLLVFVSVYDESDSTAKDEALKVFESFKYSGESWKFEKDVELKK
ncbi:MAG: hypothetical protein K8R88_04970 [Armatimonadetes bacterium]|nr:hypothetical protein [Armatimonadota bacterium]